jgi:uncharacterized membrane protein
MTLGKKTLFALLLGFDLLTNILVLTNINFLYTTTLMAFCTYVLLPGFLISLSMHIRKISLWENFLFSIGLSLIYLELGGLFLNILLPIFGINDPLAFQNLVIGFNTYILLLFVLAWRRTDELVVQIPWQWQPAVGIDITRNSEPGQPVQSGPTGIPNGELAEADTIAPLKKQFSLPGLLSPSREDLEDTDKMLALKKPLPAKQPSIPGLLKQFSLPGLLSPSREDLEDTDKMPAIRKPLPAKQPSIPGLLKQFSLPGLISTPTETIAEADAIAIPGHIFRPDFISTSSEAIAETKTMPLTPLQPPRHTKIEKVLYTLPVFFPILATLGAIVLNNGGSNILTLTLLGAIAFYVLLLVLLHSKISVNLYPYAIFFIGLASLFTTSLRSWYIAGHDIEREFYVFELTNTHHLWNMAFYQDAYNACLSITILPTVLGNLLAVPNMYVYKVIFQILFAICPIIVFFIIKNYTTPILAFLSAFFFIAFPTFFNDMAMLNRQEIGFLFFGLALYVMLLPKLSLPMRRILFFIFALGVIISHYSTNFVLLALVAFIYTANLIIMQPFVQRMLAWLAQKSPIKVVNTFPNKPFLRIAVVLLLFLMTYVWNNLYTNSSNHAGSVLLQVATSMFVKSNDQSSASEISYSIFTAHPQPSPQQELQNFIQRVRGPVSTHSTGNAAANAAASPFYSTSITDKYPSSPLPQGELAPTPLGNWLTSLHMPVFNVQAELRALSADFMQLFVFIGLLLIFFLKQKKPFDLQYLLLCFGAIVLLMLEIILPSISLDYGLLRMFQQFLFILSLPIVLGLNSILFFVKEQKRVIFTGIMAIIFFLNLTGFIAHLTGDYYPQFTLDNAGLYYDAYYVQKQDIVAMVWLSQNDENNALVDSNLAGYNKLLTYAGIYANDGDVPPVIQRDAYVFQESSNPAEIMDLAEDILYINSPQPFLNNEKNLIYSNGKDKVYK